jgi:hypothetical protein
MLEHDDRAMGLDTQYFPETFHMYFSVHLGPILKVIANINPIICILRLHLCQQLIFEWLKFNLANLLL